MPRWVEAGSGSQSDDSSESDEEEEQPEAAANDEASSAEESESEEDRQPAQQEAAAPAQGASGGKAKKAKLSISLGSLVCHVCGAKGHNAGFVGSTYVDCPNRPCYLCKQPGHTTMTCPHRAGPELDHKDAAAAAANGLFAAARQTQHDGRRREVWRPVLGWQVDAAVLKLHARRCTCLQFHPTRHNLVLSGDKQGQVAVWDHEKVYERTVWRPFRALTNNIAFLPGADGLACFAASSDGTLKALDVETGLDREALNLNPDGWIPGVSNERNWVMLHGLDACAGRRLLAVGDSQGRVHFLDPRSQRLVASQQLHKKANKVNSVHFSPADEALMVSGSNDWTARLFDIRRMSDSAAASLDAAGGSQAAAPMELARMEHPKVVNSAYFSPRTGRKLLTTCIDNRLRVWDYLLTADRPPDREIVHSHDFNRYLTPFRAEWDPKDHAERIIVIGRYISENFAGAALHPIDIFDASSGRLLQQLRDPNLATICPVNKVHPALDLIVTGSSRSLYAWRPTPPEEEEDGGKAAASAAARAQATGVQAWEHGFYFDAGGEEPGKKRKGGAAAEADEDDEGDAPVKAKGKAKKPPQPRKKKDEGGGKGKKQK